MREDTSFGDAVLGLTGNQMASNIESRAKHKNIEALIASDLC